MKRMYVLMTMLTLASLPAMTPAASAQDQAPNSKPNPDQIEQRTTGSQLMTPEERREHRRSMRRMTKEEREAYRREHHEQMKKRAEEQGKTIPDQPPANGMGGGMGMGRGGGMGGGGRSR